MLRSPRKKPFSKQRGGCASGHSLIFVAQALLPVRGLQSRYIAGCRFLRAARLRKAHRQECLCYLGVHDGITDIRNDGGGLGTASGFRPLAARASGESESAPSEILDGRTAV